jgi:hypothetical protein
MKTKRPTAVTLAAPAVLLISAAGWTADDDAEATIRLMGAAEAELPQAVMKEIAIPTDLMNAGEAAEKRAVERAEKGLAKARERGDRFDRGQLEAEEARERNAEMSEKATENRENHGRSEDRPEPPEGLPGSR